jgi:hypothetical protein
MGKRGPERKKINWDEFHRLVGMQCTQDEVAAWFDISKDWLDKLCQRDLGEKLSDIWSKRVLAGRVRLRKAQFEIMERMGPGAATMAIYLDKKMLPNENPDRPPPQDITDPAFVPPAGKLTFKEFCKKAGYPEPFDAQVGMYEFAFNDEDARLLLGSRGYGKTDYITIMGAAYHVYLYGSDARILIVTKTAARNAAILEEIANALEANAVIMEKRNSKYIKVKGNIGKDYSVEAITIRTSMRGRHPKNIIMDDPVTEEDISAAMRKLVKRKYDEAYKLCKNVLVIGQPAHADDLYATLRPILKKLEVPHGTIPQLDADLKAMLAAGIDPVSIEMSYHLKVPIEGSMPFAGIRYIDQYPAGESVAFIDPSDGGDYTAISIVRGLMNGVAVYGKAWKRAWYHCTDEMIKAFKSKGVKQVWFETNSTGSQPIDQLRALLGPHGIGVVRKHSDTNKHAVIMAAGSYANLIHLSRDSDKVYTDHVIKYEYGAEFDDAPDSLARCLECIGYIKGKK